MKPPFITGEARLRSMSFPPILPAVIVCLAPPRHILRHGMMGKEPELKGSDVGHDAKLHLGSSISRVLLSLEIAIFLFDQ